MKKFPAKMLKIGTEFDFINEITNILDLLYKHGWDERNGGNLLYLLNEQEENQVKDLVITKTYETSFDMSEILNRYFVVTGTGKYFKNCKPSPEHNLGVIKVLDSHTYGIVWGLLDGKPTSELSTHLKCHIERMKVDQKHKLVIHCHPTNIICMSHIIELNENKRTEILRKTQTESIVVFPKGIGVLPWILCGGDTIGDATAQKMKEYRSVVWAQHGLLCTGRDFDETFGLIETIEKAAEIYMKICDKKISQSISNKNLLEIAEAFHIDFKHGIID